MSKETKKFKHGGYFLELKKVEKFMFVNTFLKRGRVFSAGGKVVDLNLKSHKGIMKKIIQQGEWFPAARR